ncbi:MAG: ammonia-forming cytochrome c nitrite reductase subunit c552 [Verrucomicrobia bacterium]|jgi:nitrite reductase (cytochrome c-552)|nr:ammonia-forming cytochrome c nitrite reductase subunit c552 [Verrucomicrobiota bacterium]MBT7068558.1 ammonia-forming cytochrome c nitrite reductase subunit c552 [Verrucomicrobiota bacterium]MBT7699912.1 ammonia-forming cytochrome c nitrite reductase subunit c552 [Verrucomicrobiota bacterium]
MSMSSKKSVGVVAFVVTTVAVAAGTAAVCALLINIFERKREAENTYVRLVPVTEDTTDPAIWGKNWPRQYDSYQRTVLATRTRFGGHGGSEALPEAKIERDPWLKRMFLGYAFSIDYRDRRGHAYMLEDQEQTKRQNVPLSGSCLHCHASIMPLYRKLGDGDAAKGMDETHKMSYKDTNKMLHEMGLGHPVSCVDCHDPESMEVRVTRPGFIRGIQDLAASDAPVPAVPSIAIWRQGSRAKPYDPNKDATRGEMRSFACAQCHVEYYCAGGFPLTFPWKNGLKMEDLEKQWDETVMKDGSRFYDYKHKESGAEILKAQHPEFELWSQGIHARSGVSCSDCHMPYMRDGASKVSDHWVRSPLLNVNRACQTCHHVAEKELLARVDSIQQKNADLLQAGGAALMDLLDAVAEAKAAGATQAQLKPALEFQRKAQWRLDYIAAENSMGFHAPQEAARILAESTDYARQGQVAALRIAHQL